MPRIPRVRGLTALQLATAPATRAPFAAVRTISTSGAVQGKNTDWIRKQLWKGEAPGPEDPYTQRVEVEETNLPDEAMQRAPRDRTPWAVQESRLVLPPKRSEAVSEKQLASEDPTYVPATFVEGLEEIGTVKNWWEQPGHWGEESAFKGFAATEKEHDPAVLEVYLRRAAVEALALKEGGLLEEWAAKKWNAGDRAEMEQTLAVQLDVKEGKAVLSGDVKGLAGRLTEEVLGGVEAERVSAEEAREIVKSWAPAWKNLELDDHLKFAIRKRLYQLTGNLIPDSKLGASRTLRHLHTLIAKPPKQTRLADALNSRGLLSELSNVTLHERKITPIDKEMSVGRWKVIEEELTKRGLPVTGTMGLKRNKERMWLSGRA